MKKDILKAAVEQVISGAKSSYQASKDTGIPPATLSRAVRLHPDYEKAKADGRLRSMRSDLVPLDPVKLRQMPELQAIVAESLSYNEAARRFGSEASKWRRYTMVAYPDYAKAREKPKRQDPAQQALEDRLRALEEELLALKIRSEEAKKAQNSSENQ